MGDAPATDTEVNQVVPDGEVHLDMDRRPFGGLEFQVSEVVGRLAAGVNALDVSGDDHKAEKVRKISGSFHGSGTSSMSEILKILEEMVSRTAPTSESSESPLLPTDPISRAAILSHSIAALFGALERSHASRLGVHIAAETTRWLSHMFRLPEYNAYYHQDQLEGLVRVTRMLLHHRYPRYLEDGELAFTNRMPCIYSSVASPLGVVQHICRQLGLPLACVRPVPVDPSGRGMDVDALVRLVYADSEGGRVPLLVLGGAGAAAQGAGDALPALRRLADAHALHLHVIGHALALTPLADTQQVFSIADSLTLTPGRWFGIPGLPTVTFYKIPEPITANDHAKSANPVGSRETALAALGGLTVGSALLPALPLWVTMKTAGVNHLVAHLNSAFKSARTVHAIVAEAGLRILSSPPGGDEPPGADLVESVSGASACVAFQFATMCDERPPPYYDKLNSWLGQVLQREADMINIEVCETETHGVVLSYCPLELACIQRPKNVQSLQDVHEVFASALAEQLHVLRATKDLRDPFQLRVTEQPLLRLVHVPGWPGLGGVRYVPEGVSETDVDALNRNLVERLRAIDGAFSCGVGDDGRPCVRLAMVTADSDVDELLELVLSTGKEVEVSSKEAEDSSKEVEVSSKEVEDSSKEVEDSSKEFEDSSKEVEDSSKEIEDSSKEVEDSSKEVEDSSKELSTMRELLKKEEFLPTLKMEEPEPEPGANEEPPHDTEEVLP